MKPTLKRSLARNSEILTNIIIPVEYWKAHKRLAKIFAKVNSFRLESFGDTANEIQAINYINLCKAFPNVCFSIWSKNIWIWKAIFTKYGKPENMIYIHSSLFLDKADKIPADCMWFVNYRFTVYHKAAWQEKKITPNCCNGIEKRYCDQCNHCYGFDNMHNDFDIIETLRT